MLEWWAFAGNNNVFSKTNHRTSFIKVLRSPKAIQAYGGCKKELDSRPNLWS
jgi:hypothetical protein